MTKACPICFGVNFKTFFNTYQFDLTGCFYSQEDTGGEKMSLSSEYCSSCSFIRLDDKLTHQKDYSNVSRDTSRQLPDYSSDIISLILKNIKNSRAPIIELGSNDGTFLKLMHEEGLENILGVDPSKHLNQRARALGLPVIEALFNLETANEICQNIGRFDFALARHTLEHVPDCRDFVMSAYKILEDDGSLLIEVPDTDVILDNLHLHEIWDEHKSYFTKHSLSNLLISCGFEIQYMSSFKFRETKNLVCLAKKVVNKRVFNSCQENDMNVFNERVTTMNYNWITLKKKLSEKLITTKGPIFSLGASHTQVNFLNFSQCFKYVDYFVDDDPYKAGKFLKFDVLKKIVYSNELINHRGPGVVLDTAFLYPEWAENLKTKLHSQWKIIKIFPA